MKREYSLSISTPNEAVFASGLFSSVEFSKTAASREEDRRHISEEAKEIKHLSEKYNVKVRSFHLPFAPPFLPASLSKEERGWTMEKTRQLIEYMLPCGIEYVVLHGGVNVDLEKTQEQLDAFIEYIRELCDFCRPHAVTVAVESLKPLRIGNGTKELLYIMERVGRENVGICYDCNHFLEEDPIEFLEKAGEYVVTTHLSDYDMKAERHWYPGRGIIDWKKLVKGLEKCGYTGPYVFEVKFPGPQPNLRDIRQLCDEWEEIF